VPQPLLHSAVAAPGRDGASSSPFRGRRPSTDQRCYGDRWFNPARNLFPVLTKKKDPLQSQRPISSSGNNACCAVPSCDSRTICRFVLKDLASVDLNRLKRMAIQELVLEPAVLAFPEVNGRSQRKRRTIFERDRYENGRCYR
jgi:hypothetical protein